VGSPCHRKGGQLPGTVSVHTGVDQTIALPAGKFPAKGRRSRCDGLTLRRRQTLQSETSDRESNLEGFVDRLGGNTAGDAEAIDFRWFLSWNGDDIAHHASPATLDREKSRSCFAPGLRTLRVRLAWARCFERDWCQLIPRKCRWL
jgi:hypothetical protein